MDAKTVRELFDYRDGKTYWREDAGTRVKAGDRAGCKDALGYRRVNRIGKIYYEHHLIWLWHNGEFPEKNIDHINGIKDDNRIENLRDVSQSENLRNPSTHYKQAKNVPLGKSGIRGVVKSSPKGRKDYWEARITYHKKGMTKSFPYTDEGKEQARQWRLNKEIEFYGKVLEGRHHEL